MDNYKPLIPIDDPVSLAGLGYDGELRIIVIPTGHGARVGARLKLEKKQEAFWQKVKVRARDTGKIRGGNWNDN